MCELSQIQLLTEPIITSYKLNINASSYLKEYTQYPVDNTYNMKKGGLAKALK